MASLFGKVISTVDAGAKVVATSVTNAASSATDNIPKPSGQVKHVSVKGVSFTGIGLDVTVSVHNPYLVPIPITSIEYDMKTTAGGRTIAHGIINSPGVLKASGDTDLPVVVNILYTAFIDIIRDAAADWDIDYELKLGFVFDLPMLPAASVPFTYKSSFKLPTIADLLKGKGPTTAEQRKLDAEAAAKNLADQKKELAQATTDAINSLSGAKTPATAS